MGRVRDFFVEWRARRRGRKHTPVGLGRAAREIAGPTGSLFSAGWDSLEDGYPRYLKSFDPRIPPSLHISHQDTMRANQPIPMAERCIEDYTANKVRRAKRERDGFR